MIKAFVFAGAVALSIGSASAATITIGVGEVANAAPFSTPVSFDLRSERYQQVWDSSNFDGLGVIEIQSLSFEIVSPTGPFPARSLDAIYDFSLSTTSRPVNGLDASRTLSGYDSNLGRDLTSFGSLRYSGETGDALPSPIVEGAFVYDPGAGNLLLDLAISPQSRSSILGFRVLSTTNSNGAFSRVSQYNGTDNYGAIVTFEYEPVSVVPLPASFGFLALSLAGLGIGAGRRRLRSRSS